MTPTNRKNIIKLMLFWLVVLVSCIEPFDPPPAESPSYLVVEANITDLKEPYKVVLSRTRPLDSQYSSFETGAIVYVESGDGQQYYFEESPQGGSYYSDSSCFVGVAGQTYTLHIETFWGGAYESKPVLLRQAPAIDSLYFERDLRLNDEGATIDGIKILLDSHDPTGEQHYLKYEWEETYRIKVPYPESIAVWECYNTEYSTSIQTANTRLLRQSRVSNMEMKYVSTDGFKLTSRYKLAVRQLSINEDHFKYWNELKKISESQGTLFDPTPYDLPGNIFSSQNPDAKVIGIFGASGATEKEIYINYIELLDLDFAGTGCSAKLVAIPIGDAPPHGYCLASYGTYGEGYNYYAPRECCDCRLYGTLGVPDDWIDEN
jgi:hypothetical protein